MNPHPVLHVRMSDIRTDGDQTSNRNIMGPKTDQRGLGHTHQEILDILDHSPIGLLKRKDFAFSTPSKDSQQISTEPEDDAETAQAKAHLAKACSLLGVWMLCLVFTLVSIVYDSFLWMLFLMGICLSIIAYSVNLFWPTKMMGYLWADTDKVFRNIDFVTCSVSFSLILLKVKGLLSYSFPAGLPFLVIALVYVFVSKVQIEDRIQKVLIRLIFILQITLIGLKIDKFLDWNWELIFVLLWISLGIMTISLIKTSYLLTKKLDQPEILSNKQLKKTSYLWSSLFYSFLFTTILTFMAIVETFNSSKQVVFYILASNLCLFVHIISGFFIFRSEKDLIKFLLISGVIKIQVISFTNERPVAKVERKFQAEQVEAYFNKSSTTFFIPIPDNLLVKDEEGNVVPTFEHIVSDKKKLDCSFNSVQFRDEQITCYTCFHNVSDTIMISCGHGGACHGCAMDRLKTRSDCVICGNTIEGIFRIDTSTILNNNVVKAVEFTRVITSHA